MELKMSQVEHRRYDSSRSVPRGILLIISQDIQQATSIAYSMVTQCGMSEALGNVDLNSDYKSLSSETKQQIEHEVRRLVEEGRERATRLLTERRKDLEKIADALVEYEVLNLEEMGKVLRGEKLPEKLKALPNMPIKLPEIVLPPGMGGNPPGVGAGPEEGSGPGNDGGAMM